MVLVITYGFSVAYGLSPHDMICGFDHPSVAAAIEDAKSETLELSERPPGKGITHLVPGGFELVATLVSGRAEIKTIVPDSVYSMRRKPPASPIRVFRSEKQIKPRESAWRAGLGEDLADLAERL